MTKGPIQVLADIREAAAERFRLGWEEYARRVEGAESEASRTQLRAERSAYEDRTNREDWALLMTMGNTEIEDAGDIPYLLDFVTLVLDRAKVLVEPEQHDEYAEIETALNATVNVIHALRAGLLAPPATGSSGFTGHKTGHSDEPGIYYCAACGRSDHTDAEPIRGSTAFEASREGKVAVACQNGCAIDALHSEHNRRLLDELHAELRWDAVAIACRAAIERERREGMTQFEVSLAIATTDQLVEQARNTRAPSLDAIAEKMELLDNRPGLDIAFGSAWSAIVEDIDALRGAK